MPIAARLHRAHGALTTLSNGRHVWLSDISEAAGSTELAPDPHDLLDSALAACTTLTLELYIRRRQLPVTELRVQVSRTEEKTADGRLRYTLQRDIHIDGPLSEPDRQRLLEIAGKCPIHRLLEGEVVVHSALAPAEGALP